MVAVPGRARRGSPDGGPYAVRRSPAVRRRIPWWRLLFPPAVALALVAVGWWLMNGGIFAVSRIDTGAYRFTDEAELQAALAPLLGRNIFKLGEDEVAAALTGLPWLRDLRLSRRLPDVVTVDFREWRPILAVPLQRRDGAGNGDDGLLVEDGRILVRPSHLPAPALPVLVGVEVVGDGDGSRRLPDAWAEPVVAVVAAMETSGLEAVSPVDFVVARPEGFAIVLQEGQGTLLLGREDFAPRLARYMTARERIEPGLEVDLRFRDRITVKESAVPR